MKTTVAVVDDHRLLSEAIAELVQSLGNYDVLFRAENGEEMIRHFNEKRIPDIVILDINMPKMDGFETAIWLKNNYPQVKILVLSIIDNREIIVKMLQIGISGYLVKGCRSEEIKRALDAIVITGFYYSDMVTELIAENINPPPPVDPKRTFDLTDNEITFIKLACSELTYAEIAGKMTISNDAVDVLRERVFQKMGVRSRVNLALEAVRLGIVSFP